MMVIINFKDSDMSASSRPTRKQISHDNIVRVAGRAMRRSGYDGASVAEIMKQAGLTHGGFYAHFDSREAMLIEALQHSGEHSAAQLAEGAAQLRALGASPLQALVQAYLSDRHLAACDEGCPLAALGSEMPRQGEALQQAARHRLGVLLDLVRRPCRRPRPRWRRPC
jgi:AcrR family transcriptional regulator